MAAAGRESRARNPEQAKARAGRYVATHPDRVRATRQRYYEQGGREKRVAWQRANADKARLYRWRAKYGEAAPVLLAALEAAVGRCALCRREPGARGLHLDHDHGCCPAASACLRCFRGFLCHNCNVALGHLRDDPVLLRKAAAYLEKPRG